MAYDSVPPGFTPCTSFVLKRVADDEEPNCSNALVVAPGQEPIEMDTMYDWTDTDNLKRCLKDRPWILFNQSGHKSESSDSEQLEMDPPAKTCLPKGVAHGCPDSSDCLKVTGRWHPDGAIRDALEEAPVFHPTEEEFKDTLVYIANIRARAENYGMCRIVPPPSWKPPCLIKENNIWKTSTFSTHIQRIDGLWNQSSPTTSVDKSTRKKRKRISRVGADNGSTSGPGENRHCFVKGFESEPGPEFTLAKFKRYAANFKLQYFRKDAQDYWAPSIENIEAEYKRIAVNPTEGIEVLCGDNLETRPLGTGFPIVSNDSNPSEASSCPEYLTSGWNLNNLPRLRGSLLSFENHDTSRILVPQGRVGMCFSSFHWKVEEHHLYSLSYLHMGAPKVWYGVPREYYHGFETVMKNTFPDSLEEQSESCHRVVKQLSPSILKSRSIPVFRCIQNSGEFVLVLPRTYHSGFDCGFNFSETACVAPMDWLPYGLDAAALYCTRGRRTSISTDKLMLEAAREAVRAQWDALFRKNTSNNLLHRDAYGKDGILTSVFKSRVSIEGIRRQYLCNSSQSKKMEPNFDSTAKRECSICLSDLHFSAAGCPCSADTYSCLLHAKELCYSCAWSEKIFLYRHEISDLNILLEALQGRCAAVYKWAKEDLRLAVHTPQKSPDHVDNPTSDAQEIKHTDSASLEVTRAEVKAEVKARLLKSTIANMSKSDDHSMGPLDSATELKAKLKARMLESSVSSTSKANDHAARYTDTATEVKAQMQARMLQSISKKPKADDHSAGYPNTATEVKAQVKARILQSISDKSKASDHPMSSLATPTAKGNDGNSVASILAKVKAQVRQQKPKDEPTIIASPTENNASPIPMEAMGTTDGASQLLTDVIVVMSDVSSVNNSDPSSSDSDCIMDLDFLKPAKEPMPELGFLKPVKEESASPPVKQDFPAMLSKGGHRSGNRASWSHLQSHNRKPRQPPSESEIYVISDDSDG